MPARHRTTLLTAVLIWLLASWPALSSAQTLERDASRLDDAPLGAIETGPRSGRMMQRQQAGISRNSVQRRQDGGRSYQLARQEEGLLSLEEGSGEAPATEDGPQLIDDQQIEGTTRKPGALDCDFGSKNQATLCAYSNANTSVFAWQVSTGKSANWLGGPPADAGNSEEGGYAFFETSQTADESVDSINRESAMLESALQSRSPPGGQCLQFDYHRLGLSAYQLRVMLHPVSEQELQGYPTDHRSDTVLWSCSPDITGRWQKTELLYNYPGDYTLAFEAIPHSSEGYRGHIALDAIRLNPAGCVGHCTFDGGPCGWSQDERQDDFQWQPSRGSLSRKTGPRADHGSEMLGGTSGGYMFVDSGYPRRPGDRARLLSPELAPTADGQPLCFRFWIYMFGPGVGTLRVLLLAGSAETELWKLSGPSGKQWHQGLVTASSDVKFKLVLEAELGMERLGDIAVDDVSLKEGICPAAPQAAALWSSGCTFEVDMCGWANTPSWEAADRGAWERLAAAAAGAAPAADHTTGLASGSLVRLVPEDPPPPGHRARLVSPVLQRPAGTDMCLTFRYYMDQGVVTGSGSRLGGLRAWAEWADSDSGRRPQLLWQLVNAQQPGWLLAQAPIADAGDVRLVLEGMWAGGGGGRQDVIAVDDIVLLEGTCKPTPPQSRPSAGDCHFTHDACGWGNTTSDEQRQQRWRAAAPLMGPAPRILLTDHTFRAATGYVYFDVFSPQERRQQLRLVSPLLEPISGGRACVRFWFAHLSPSEPTELRVLHESVTAGSGGDEAEFEAATVLWSLRASETGARRLTWLYGQAGFGATRSFRVTFEGAASKYGFALDDVIFTAGDCEVRPSNAAPSSEDRPLGA